MFGLVLYKNNYLGGELPLFNGKFIDDKTVLYSNNNNTILINNNYLVSKKELLANNTIDKFINNFSNSLKQLPEDTSLFIYNKQNKSLYVARDRIGVQPIYYYKSDKIFILSNQIKFINEYIGIVNLDNNFINAVLTGMVYDKETTAIKGIKKLPPAHCLIFENDNLTIKEYWKLEFKGFNNLSLDENIFQLEENIKNSIKRRITNTTGAELSGGLDSSTIVGISSKLNKNIHTYSHSLPNNLLNKFRPYNDEREYFNKVIKYNNISEFHKNITCNNIGIFDIIEKELDIQGVPINNTLPYLSNELINSAEQDGIKTIFSGFGGDEGVSNMGSYQFYNWAQKINIYQLLKNKRNPIKAIYSAYFKSLINLKEKNNSFFINYEFKQKMQSEQKLNDLFKNFKFKNLNEFIIYKLNENYIPNRIESMAQSAMNRDIEYSYPLLDYKLLEFYISIPDKYKFYKAKRRYIFKEAIKNYVPNSVYLRTDKTGATIPNVLHRFMIDYDKIYNFLQSNRNGKAAEFINFNKMIGRMQLIKRLYNGERIRADQHIFFNALMLVMYLEKNH